MRHLNERTFRVISNHVVEECRRRGVDGAFAMAPTDLSVGQIYYRLVLRMNPLDHASDGKKYDLLAIALAKLSEVLSHGRASGQAKYIGEVPYKGGRISYNGEYVYAFAGAHEEVDDEIMLDAERFHATL